MLNEESGDLPDSQPKHLVFGRATTPQLTPPRPRPKADRASQRDALASWKSPNDPSPLGRRGLLQQGDQPRAPINTRTGVMLSEAEAPL